MILRGGGAARDTLMAALIAQLPDGAPSKRLPAHIDEERLLGGLDLTASLSGGRAVAARGLLAEAAGGVVIAPMAERIAPALAGRLAFALDAEATFALIALDDGVEDERVPAAIAERLAFHLDLDAAETPVAPDVVPVSEDEARTALAEAAANMGIESLRPVLFAWRTVRALAVGRGIERGDVLLAARLVLAPRAIIAPPAPAQNPEHDPGDRQSSDEESGGESLTELILAAARATLPPELFANRSGGPARRGAAGSARGSGERLRNAVRGRPSGVRAGLPRGGARLALIETLRAAAPWQKLRGASGRVKVLRDDLRIRRVEARMGVTTIVAVDASGSAALARLAEAKGAVELMLSRAYIDRAEVALIAFRKDTAELLLPPTRSLARAKRALAELPGGGGTPLAAGLVAANALARQVRGRGRSPRIALLTDGRGNIALDGGADRAAAEADATRAARLIAEARVPAVFIDIATRPRPEGARLAAAMGARYLALPRGDARALDAALADA